MKPTSQLPTNSLKNEVNPMVTEPITKEIKSSFPPSGQEDYDLCTLAILTQPENGTPIKTALKDTSMTSNAWSFTS